jgi:hypothetical protein
VDLRGDQHLMIRRVRAEKADHRHADVQPRVGVRVRVTAEGTHLGEWLGIKPSDRLITLRGINLDRVQDGR